MRIDTSFDFRTDANGKDPDSYSPTLRRYHKLLWSKRLPGGAMFDLDDTTQHAYLHHRSGELGEFYLASDSIIPSFWSYASLRSIILQVPPSEIEEFRSIGYTIGGMMVFPGNRVDGRQTINGARGFHPKIRDRMDLTLECIRRHYAGQASPLAGVLARHSDFFALFEDFREYVRFFLLDDLVTHDFSAVRILMSFDDFRTSALPGDVETYAEYRRRSVQFIEARNSRIAQWAASPGADLCERSAV